MIRALELTFGGITLAFVLGLWVYVLGSFALMRRHAESRHPGAWLREIVREMLLAGVMQPFLPLYYFFGRRMDGFLARVAARTGEPSTPVVFVHGYMQNRVGFVGLARELARRGIGPLYGFNYPWFSTIDDNARRLEKFIAKVCAETGRPKVDLVCHSMGGLVAMEMMRRQGLRAGPTGTAEGPPDDQELAVRRCVTIATPHAGVMWQGPMLGFGATNMRRGSKLLEAHAASPLKVPTLSIYSSHDNVVHPKASSSLVGRGGRDMEIAGRAHFAILFSPEVAASVATFLSEPDPAPASA